MRAQVHDFLTDMMSRWVLQGNTESVDGMRGGRTVEVRGHKIWYQDFGRGRPVIFLHGLGASSLSWLFTLPALGANWRTIALDHIGHGRSARPPLSYRISDFVDYLEAFLDHMKLGEVDLVGNSLGGWIAARLAVKRPELVNRLVLVCSAGLQPTDTQRAHLEKVPFAPRTLADTRRILSLCFYNKTRYANGISVGVSYLLRRLEANHRTVEKVIASALDPNEWMDQLAPQISARTLVLWGRHDELLPLEQGERYARTIPNAKLMVLEDCGHVPQIERPKDFNRVLADFLSSGQ